MRAEDPDTDIRIPLHLSGLFHCQTVSETLLLRHIPTLKNQYNFQFLQTAWLLSGDLHFSVSSYPVLPPNPEETG